MKFFTLFAVVTAHAAPLSAQLKNALWSAYGKPLKYMAIIGLCAVLVGPVFLFFRRLIR